MRGKSQWFLLGLLGAVVAMVTRLVRGRRIEHEQALRWEPVPGPEPARQSEGGS